MNEKAKWLFVLLTITAILGCTEVDCGKTEILQQPPVNEGQEPDIGNPDSGVPDTGELDNGEPENGEPDNGEPQPPKDTEPDQGEPDSGEPQPPEVTEPDNGDPNTGEPQPPEITEPEPTDPDNGEPDSGEPNTGETQPPVVTEPEPTDPDNGEPDSGEPNTGEPDNKEPETGEPEPTDPDNGEPQPPEPPEPDEPQPPEAEIAEPLTANEWLNVTTTKNDKYLWYTFKVKEGETYYLWWNDKYDGNKTKTADIIVGAMYANGKIIFGGNGTNWSSSFQVDSAYNKPQSFTADKTGTVYLRVWNYIEGTFGIIYNSSGVFKFP